MLQTQFLVLVNLMISRISLRKSEAHTAGRRRHAISSRSRAAHSSPRCLPLCAVPFAPEPAHAQPIDGAEEHALYDAAPAGAKKRYKYGGVRHGSGTEGGRHGGPAQSVRLGVSSLDGDEIAYGGVTEAHRDDDGSAVGGDGAAGGGDTAPQARHDVRWRACMPQAAADRPRPA
eukprot:IDg9943t1